MSNIDLLVSSDMENLISQTKFKRIFFLCSKKKKSYHLSRTYRNIKRILKKKITKFHFKSTFSPEIVELKELIVSLNKFSPDLIIAVGGGTVMDYAKIANCFTAVKNIEKKIINNSYTLKHKIAKLIVIPTTAGSGGEVTSNGVIYINKKKYSVESKLVKPDYFFLIPEFVKGAPKIIKSSAGFDAIAQAVESLISKKSNFASVRFAKKSLKISLKYYLDFLSNPTKENTAAMSLAANLSGKAINISKTTAPHAVSYPFTALYNIRHGLAVSLTFEKFMRFNYLNYNKSDCDFNLRNRYEDIFSIFKVKDINDFENFIINLKKKANLKSDFAKLKIDLINNFDKIISGVNLLRLENNPISLKQNDIKTILLSKNFATSNSREIITSKTLINDKKISSSNVFNIVNPFTKTTVGKVINSSAEHIRHVLEKSYNFQCSLSPVERSNIFTGTINQLNKNKKYFAKLITSESGISLKDSFYEIGRVINCAKYSAIVCKIIERDITNDFIFNKKEKPKLKVITEPLDLVIAITPFNHPMNMVAHKIFPAIIAGTSIVLKPSEKAPLSAIKLVEVLIENGMPANMVNVVTGKNGKNTVAKLLSFSKLDMVTFTGGLAAGLDIRKTLIEKGHSLKKYVPELGGCSSLIVCSDADLSRAVKIILNGCFKNSGQRCTSIRRVIVEQNIVDNLIDDLLKKVKEIKYGNPFQEDTDIGTVIDEESAIKIQKRINSAIKDGAKLLYGNKRKGALLSPTVLDDVKVTMDLVAKETFGPICSIIRSKNFDESLDIAKNTNYRLAGAIVTRDKSKAEEASQYLKVGQFSFNGPPSYRTETAPFGGFGDSGIGEKEGILLASNGMRRTRTFYKH